MPPREDYILFLDLETTGVDVPKDEIIEVGLSLVSTEEGYPEVSSFSSVVVPSDPAYLRMMNKDVVREMHEKNGLLSDVRTAKYADNRAPFMMPNVDQRTIEWLEAGPIGQNTTHIPLGGSGVLHFDRRFIKHFMPRLDVRLTHWAYDVGVLRRSFIKAGVKYADMSGKTHRALDDARVHADEWRYYQKVIGGLERA